MQRSGKLGDVSAVLWRGCQVEIVLQHKLGIGTIAWGCATVANGVDEGGERLKVALVGYVDAWLGESGAFVLSTLYGFGKVQVDA